MLHSIAGWPDKVTMQVILIQPLLNLGRPEWYQSEAATWFRDSCPAWMAASAVLTLTAAAVEPLLDVTWLLTPELGELDVPFAWPLPPELRWETSVTCRQHVKRKISWVAYSTKVQPNITRTATDTARLLMFVWSWNMLLYWSQITININ